jgi:hypothetical protein
MRIIQWVIRLFGLSLLLPLVPVNAAAAVLETFESAQDTWVVASDASGGTVTRSTAQAAAGTASALLHTGGSGQSAAIRTSFSSAATGRIWQERPGDWRWQRTRVYIPSATVSALSGSEYFTLTSYWVSANTSQYGWQLRVTSGGALRVRGANSNGSQQEFPAYGTVPLDQWFDLEIGLHSQSGQGVKRAFAFLINGNFYGWYRQGKMDTETYDRSAIGILSTNSPDSLNVYVDEWRTHTTGNFPDGTDNRSTASVQEQNFRTLSGVQVQYDWSTWQYQPTLHATYGLYSPTTRLQAGRNIDRMPSVTDGWGEIEIDWPNGTPPTCTNNYCSAMIGFHKEVNREENLEVIPHANASGVFSLWFEAWLGGTAQKLAEWQLPAAAAAPGRYIPEPGDIIRARWEQISCTQINVRASYYDASANLWYSDIINSTFNATFGAINYLDGNHTAASITIDSQYYSIRRFKLGTLASYPGSSSTGFGVGCNGQEAPTRNATTDTTPTLTWNPVSWALRYEIRLSESSSFMNIFYSDTAIPANNTTWTAPMTLSAGTYYWQVRACSTSTGGCGAWSATDTLQVL